jgi:hypothetical protein
VLLPAPFNRTDEIVAGESDVPITFDPGKREYPRYCNADVLRSASADLM